MKPKFKIFGTFILFIAILLLIGSVSASNDDIDNTIKTPDVKTAKVLNADENNLNIESENDDTNKQEETSQNQVISQTNDDNLGNSTDLTDENAKQEGVITSGDLKTDYHSGRAVKTIIKDKSTGKGIATILNVQYLKNGKVICEEDYCTGSNGAAYITPTIPVGVYKVKISISKEEGNVTAKTIYQKVTIVKTSTKVTVKKIRSNNRKVTLKATLSKTKMNSKINEGKVQFKINGKTYTAKVKNGAATKTVNLPKFKTYKYTAQFMGTKNIKKSKIASQKVCIIKRLATKITVKNVKGNSSEQRKYQITITTTSGKKVTSGQLKLTWNGKTLLCNVTNGVVKLVVTFGSNFKKEVNGNQYYYKQCTTKYTAKYIPTSSNYRGSSANYKIISTYKCTICGKTASHTHKANETTIKIYVV